VREMASGLSGIAVPALLARAERAGVQGITISSCDTAHNIHLAVTNPFDAPKKPQWRYWQALWLIPRGVSEFNNINGLRWLTGIWARTETKSLFRELANSRPGFRVKWGDAATPDTDRDLGVRHQR
jgi:hypothetical protein